MRQLLVAASYSVSQRLVLDAGAARSLRAGAPVLVGVHRLHLARGARLLSVALRVFRRLRANAGHIGVL